MWILSFYLSLHKTLLVLPHPLWELVWVIELHLCGGINKSSSSSRSFIQIVIYDRLLIGEN